MKKSRMNPFGAGISLVLGFLQLGTSEGAAHRCTTPPVARKQKESMVQTLKELEKKETKSNVFARSSSLHQRMCKQCINIDTYYVIFQPSPVLAFDPNNEENIYVVTEQDARTQFDLTVQHFSDTPFTFTLKDIKFIQNDNYYRYFEDADIIGAQYRQGGWDTLNVYWGQVDKGSFAVSPGLGVAEQGPVPPIDGVWNDIGSMIGINPNEEYDTHGTTAAHEIGHWLGLFHTFAIDDTEFQPCDPNNPNDYIDDTPQQKESTDGCPADGYDSCPDIPGLDPIHNFMDYANGACTNEFTPGQSERMYYVWSLYRKQDESCGVGYVLFEFELVSDGNAWGINWQLESTDGSLFINQKDNDLEASYYDLEQNQVSTKDICIESGKQYTFIIFNSQGTGLQNNGLYRVRLDGEIIKEGKEFGSQERTTFSAGAQVPQTMPTPVPLQTPFPVFQPVLLPTPDQSENQPLASVTLEIQFGFDTEDISILVQTYVTVGSTPEVVYDKPFDAFPESTYQNDYFVETINVKKGVLYHLEVRHRNGANGITEYALYDGESVNPANLRFRVTNPGTYEGNTFIIEATNITPVQPPVSAPTADTGSIPSGFCFSGSTLVQVEGKDSIHMNELQVGDRVLVNHQSSTYEQVYSFGHRDEQIEVEYLQILPSKLILSKHHMVFIENRKGFVPANMVKIGDQLSTGEIVTSIQTLKETGAFAPYTNSGTIVVNGVLASNYIAFQGSNVLLLGGIRTPFHFQWLDHVFLFPLRIWSYWLGQKDPITPSGLSTVVQPLYNVALWYLRQNSIVMTILAVPIVAFVATMSSLESLFLIISTKEALAVVFIVLITRKTWRLVWGKRKILLVH